jgi:putative N6-adenine-specific DNA methylase
MVENTPGAIAAPGVVFLVGIPGLEDALEAEALRAGFDGVTRVPGGVEIAGGLAEAARANMVLRTAVRVLWRVASFRAMHLAQLDKRSRKLPWADWLRPEVPVRVEAVCRASRIYHDKAARQRVAGALEAAGFPVSPEAGIAVKVRIEDDLCIVSLDTSGEPLHRRGHKQFVGKAPLRETMAAAFLWQMGFDGTQTVVGPDVRVGDHPAGGGGDRGGAGAGARPVLRLRGDGGRRCGPGSSRGSAPWRADGSSALTVTRGRCRVR